MTKNVHNGCYRGDSSMQRGCDFIQFPVIHGHYDRSSLAFSLATGEFKGQWVGFMMLTFSNSSRVSPIFLCPPGNLYSLAFVTFWSIGKATDGYWARPLRTSFTTHTLSLNSPAVIYNHRLCRISTHKIYSGIREMYTVYSFSGKCPIRKEFGFLHSNCLTPIAVYHRQGSQENAQGCHKSENNQFLCPPVPRHVHSWGTN